MDGGHDEQHLFRDQVVAATIGILWGLPMVVWAFASLGVIAAATFLVFGAPLAMLFGIFAVERAVATKRRLLDGRRDPAASEPRTAKGRAA